MDGNGRVLGVGAGSANLTLRINNASATVPVDVYRLEADVFDEGQADAVTNKASGLIGAIVSDKNDAGIDVVAADVGAAAAEIEAAVQAREKFDVSSVLTERGEDELGTSWSDVQAAAGDVRLAYAYGLGLSMGHTGEDGERHELGRLTAFGTDVSFELPAPADLPAVPACHVREFRLARIRDGLVETVAASPTERGTYVVQADKPCEYVLVYEDVASTHAKTFTTTVTKATLSEDGKVVKRCAKCGDVVSEEIVRRPATFALAATTITYDGKRQEPGVVVKDTAGKVVSSADYKVTYANNVQAGNAQVTITFGGRYSGTKKLAFTIAKAANTLAAKGAVREVLASAVGKRAVTVACPAVVSGAVGKVTYAKAGGSAALAVNGKTGKVTVRKGTRKGTYKVKIKVGAAGNANVKAGSKTVTGKVVVHGKLSNTLTVEAVGRSASFSTLKKKAVTVARPMKVSGAVGKVTYAKAGGSAALAVNGKTGKVTVRKGTRKGTYKVKIKVSAAGNDDFEAGSVTAICKVVVK